MLPVLLAGMLALGACTEVPKEHFAAYKNAFAKSQAAQAEVLANFTTDAEALKTAIDEITREESAGGDAAFRASPSVSALPSPLTQGSTDARLTLQDHVQQRVIALETIAQYNEVLTAFANGESAEQLSEQLNGLKTSATALLQTAGQSIPGFGIVFNAFVEAVELLEKEQSRVKFKEAVEEGLPMVERIIAFLVDDVRIYDRAHLIRAEGELNALGDRLLEASLAIGKLAGSRREGTVPALTARVEAVQDLINVTKASIRNTYAQEGRPPETPDFEANGIKPDHPDFSATPELDELAVSQIEQFAEDVKDIDRERATLVERALTVRNMLVAYQNLLIVVSNGLREVEENLDRPRDPVVVARELTTLIVSLRGYAEKLRALN